MLQHLKSTDRDIWLAKERPGKLLIWKDTPQQVQQDMLQYKNRIVIS